MEPDTSTSKSSTHLLNDLAQTLQTAQVLKRSIRSHPGLTDEQLLMKLEAIEASAGKVSELAQDLLNGID